MSITIRGNADEYVNQVAQALERYDADHPGSQIVIYRQSTVSIRVRVVDPTFAPISWADRHDAVWHYIETLPEDVQFQISLLLPLTPQELPTSFANLEFDNPIRPAFCKNPSFRRPEAMLNVTAGHRRLCDGLRRREVLRIGAAGLLGLNLPDLVKAATGPRSKVRSCILMFLEGGPAHQDTWDMKPDAPEQIRGEFRPIETTVPGLLFCEHLPMLAKQAHHFAVVRSVHHTIADHNAGAYYAMTGRSPVVGGKLITSPSGDDFPPFGAVLAKLRPSGRPLPDFVHTPDWMSNNGSFLPGQGAGFLGGGFDPFVTGDPSRPGYKIPGLDLPRELSLDRVGRRRDLLDAVSRAVEPDSAIDAMDAHYRKAFDLISSSEARKAFDLSKEPQSVRERYGLDPRNDRKREARKFGGLPQLGQTLLLTRRLIEAGVRLVTVCSGPRFDQTWDTHRDHFPLLKQSILPYFDRGFSALIADLHDRGLLDETLVVAVGEFGRTPRVGQITSDAGADKGGRDHWPHCYSALFAGAGLPAGVIFGASDSSAAHPARDPVTPADIAATVYKALGLDPDTLILDPLNRPYALSTGTPIKALVG